VRSRSGAGPGGDWPRTNRVLPWLVAGFIAMVWLVPFDSMLIGISLPIDPKPDRIYVALLALAWAASLCAAGAGRPRWRPSQLTVVVTLLAGVAVVSVLANFGTLSALGEVETAIKKLALLFSYLVLFVIVATAVRPAELRNFALFIVVLACITSLGVIWEYRVGPNLFFDWADRLAPPGLSVAPEPEDEEFARRSITGPTTHGLAVTAMLAMAVGFAIALLLETKERRRRVAYGIATGVILAGAVSTQRKTAAVAPVAALIVLFLYRPRPMLRLAPLGIGLVLFIQFLSPGSLASIRGQLEPDRLETQGTTQDRSADYDAVSPDVLSDLALGRGFGTYDAHKYRLLDNQYLQMLIGTGVLGLCIFLALMLVTINVAHPAIRTGDPARAGPALGAAAGAGSFLVAAALFDTMAYPSATYVLFLIAGLAVVAASDVRQRGEAPARRPRQPLRPVAAGSARG
jgi:hypothetical protein